MIKSLPRRTFLKKAGAMSILTLTVSHAFALSQAASAISSGLNAERSLLHILSEQKHNLQFLHDTQLLNAYKTALSQWQTSGYEAHGTDYHICQRNGVALFPMGLRHASMGFLDEAVLCFGKNQAGSWVQLKSLSGFDLKALTMAAKDLQTHNPAVNVADYLLPAPCSTPLEPFSFITSKGSVSIKTFLCETNSRTEISVKEGNRILFEQKISSTHLLV